MSGIICDYIWTCDRAIDRFYRAHDDGVVLGGNPCWSWILASACVGFIIGLSAKKLNIQDGDFGFGKGILFGIVNIFAHAAAWRFVAPILDILIFAEPANKVSVWAFL